MNDMVQEKIANVLSNVEFLKEIKDLEPEELFETLKKKVPEATEEEIGEFLLYISKYLEGESDDLSEEDLENVAGGFGFTLTVAVLGGIVKGIGVAAAVGGVVGTAAWYYKHRKCV